MGMERVATGTLQHRFFSSCPMWSIAAQAKRHIGQQLTLRSGSVTSSAPDKEELWGCYSRTRAISIHRHPPLISDGHFQPRVWGWREPEGAPRQGRMRSTERPCRAIAPPIAQKAKVALRKVPISGSQQNELIWEKGWKRRRKRYTALRN